MPSSAGIQLFGLELTDHLGQGHGPQQAKEQQRGQLQLHSFIQPNVAHIPQQYSWDCGLACVLMVLRALGCSSCDFQQLRRLSQTTSVWTVDLAHLLAHFGAAVTFCTITIGINGDYANEWFYMEHLEHDERRVQQLFRQADRLGISVQQRSVPLQELVAAVGSGRQLAILLVDRRKIDPWQAAADIAWNYTTGVTSATSYTGHYILLAGYEPPAAAAAAKPAAVAGHEVSSGDSSNSSCSSSSNSSDLSQEGQQQQQPVKHQTGPLDATAAAAAVEAVAGSASGSVNSMSRELPACMAAAEPPGQLTKGCAAAAAPDASALRLGYFWVQDPAQSRGPIRVPVAIVDSARKSFGTDEDLLLVDMGVPLGSRRQGAAAVACACEDSSWAAACCAGLAFGHCLGQPQGAQQQQQQHVQASGQLQQGQQQYEQCTVMHCDAQQQLRAGGQHSSGYSLCILSNSGSSSGSSSRASSDIACPANTVGVVHSRNF